MKKPTTASRSKARRFVLQALYQMRLSDTSAIDVFSQFCANHDMKRVDTKYLREMLLGIDANREILFSMMAPKLERKIEELDPIEMAALLVGAYELQYKIEIPYRVVINEGVELAKQFGASESHKLVNSVLDALAQDVRELEYKARSG